MVRKDDRLVIPHGNTVIWRYTSIEKFIDLLMTQELFFTNAGKMTDKYEGVIPQKNEKNIYKYLKEKGYNDSDARIESDILLHNTNALKFLTLINCWSINQVESYALWKIYLDGAKSGIAIKSTVSGLKRAFNNGNDHYDEDIYLSQVEYSDYIREDPYSRLKLISTKNKYYENEKELRAIIFHYPKSEGGVKTPYDKNVGRKYKVNLNDLIHEIYLSPFTGSWANDSIKRMISVINPEFKNRIHFSKILDE